MRAMAHARLKFPTPQESHGDTGLIARVAGVLYAAGAVLVAASLLLPHPSHSNDGAILAIAGTAALASALLFAFARRLPSWLLQVVMGLGSALISLCVYFAGQPSAYVAMFVWVVLSSAFFFPGRRTALQMAWLLAVYAAVLYSIPSSGYSPLTRLLLTGLAFGTAAAVVSWLSAATNRRVVDSESRARTDPLTGIANRRWLDQELERELAWAKRHDAPLSAAIIDLDDLKVFNDEHGHLAGDRLLISAVAAWQEVIRPSDFLARIGGDEFMLLMPDCSAEAGMAVLSRIRAATPAGTSCSTGLAIWDEVETGLELFERADAALYAAKRGGGDQTVVVAKDDSREALNAPG
jgi:diguanylate cyclase (GGDEF)-like protein